MCRTVSPIREELAPGTLQAECRAGPGPAPGPQPHPVLLHGVQEEGLQGGPWEQSLLSDGGPGQGVSQPGPHDSCSAGLSPSFCSAPAGLVPTGSLRQGRLCIDPGGWGASRLPGSSPRVCQAGVAHVVPGAPSARDPWAWPPSSSQVQPPGSSLVHPTPPWREDTSKGCRGSALASGPLSWCSSPAAWGPPHPRKPPPQGLRRRAQPAAASGAGEVLQGQTRPRGS